MVRYLFCNCTLWCEDNIEKNFPLYVHSQIFSKYGFAHFEHPFYVSKIKNRETQIEKMSGKIPLDRAEYRYFTP